jgi:hypothetical protein
MAADFADAGPSFADDCAWHMEIDLVSHHAPVRLPRQRVYERFFHVYATLVLL